MIKKIEVKCLFICSYVRLGVNKSIFFIYKLLKLLVRAERESYEIIS